MGVRSAAYVDSLTDEQIMRRALAIVERDLVRLDRRIATLRRLIALDDATEGRLVLPRGYVDSVVRG